MTGFGIAGESGRSAIRGGALAPCGDPTATSRGIPASDNDCRRKRDVRLAVWQGPSVASGWKARALLGETKP